MRVKYLVLSSALIAAAGCGGGGGGGGETISGVWKGEYTGSAPTSGATPKGPICLEINQNGAQVSGSAWVSGYIWSGSYSGTVSGNTFTGQVSGKDLNNNDVTVSFDASVSGNNITGRVTVTVGSQTQTYNITLEKESDPNCGWANRDLASAFGQALGNASGSSSLGTALASFITSVPQVNVSIDGSPPQNWWVCIWEVRERDASKTPTKEYTIGGIIEDQNFSKGIGWYVEESSNLNSVPHYIGLDSNLNSRNVNVTNLNGSVPKVAGYFDFLTSSLFMADGGVEDVYKTSGTSLPANSDPFYVSECDSATNTQYKVWMTTINDFCITFNTTTPANRSASAPPDACTGTAKVDALYIEKVTCTP
ncbi:hypothetical protein [Hydrogenivirga sp. 128-5-R1-1]|uniref:hypothetical protein n=1 Tax=Hydrogenivirga sp. 128-5-R1-1 TaxID=392423 RepID=UPI00015F3676|nr:hypothetical protein [Hydrogenivirga sp. 128-5-R1-1]EDP76389.1 hypothetical protein HG1285_02243 [Hydrogenivirga sp. 128-5-R1-1]